MGIILTLWSVWTVIALYLVVRHYPNEVKLYTRYSRRLHQKIQLLQRHKAETLEWLERYKHMAHWIEDDRDAAEAEVEKLKKEIEQMRTQMAGISVAAFGGTKDPATWGTYGWSVPYRDVLNLRRRYDKVREMISPEVLREIEKEHWRR